MAKSIQDEIKTYYGGIAKKVSENAKAKASCGCGTACCGDTAKESILYSEDFTAGIPVEAINASLGCANPLVLAICNRVKLSLTWAAAEASTS